MDKFCGKFPNYVLTPFGYDNDIKGAVNKKLCMVKNKKKKQNL